MNFQLELTRNNVTPAKFFAEIRFACKKKGIDVDLDLTEFVNPSTLWNSSYSVIGNKKISYCSGYKYEYDASTAPCKAEVCKSLPYESQTYILNFDGSCYNEIIEFTFDDEKTGHGYYFLMNRDAEKEDK